MTDTPSQKHVFMSYSRRDEAVMRRVAEFLRKQGINVWVDNEKLVPGTPVWEEAIEKAIHIAGAVVVILSPDSKSSVWVRREISFAERYRKRIFPVMASGDEDTSVTLRLITSQYVDIRENEELGLTSLSITLSFYLEDLSTREQREMVIVEEEAKEKSKPKANKSADRKKTNRKSPKKFIQQNTLRFSTLLQRFRLIEHSRMVYGAITLIVIGLFITAGVQIVNNLITTPKEPITPTGPPVKLTTTFESTTQPTAKVEPATTTEPTYQSVVTVGPTITIEPINQSIDSTTKRILYDTTHREWGMYWGWKDRDAVESFGYQINMTSMTTYDVVEQFTFDIDKGQQFDYSFTTTNKYPILAIWLDEASFNSTKVSVQFGENIFNESFWRPYYQPYVHPALFVNTPGQWVGQINTDGTESGSGTLLVAGLEEPPISFELLRNYSILWLHLPFNPFLPEEQSAILEYLNHGGTVLIVMGESYKDKLSFLLSSNPIRSESLSSSTVLHLYEYGPGRIAWVASSKHLLHMDYEGNIVLSKDEVDNVFKWLETGK